MSQFDSILVANRGEIALRVMRTARDLGYRTVAVYSDADRNAPHVAFADAAVHIGAAPVGESYLDAAKVIAAAEESGAQAIHPGYGFLSENADFARACDAAGVVFIGPTPDAIDLMGNKAAAKRRMIEAGVPCVPGYEDEDQSDNALIAAAAGIGFPIMVKAAAGGGGRGMRLVEAADGLPDALAAARSEAENAFGSGELILEKAIIEPRHVEIQVFADTHGQTVHMGERDCSVQRRHQKVIEEAPCPVMTEELRVRMGAAAVDAAKSIGYRGAGTVEFLLDADGAFYFLEMNTRLQVEHPVTEMVTGLDLVALQIQVARGEPLGLSQDDIALSGHAIEVRLYAEDPAQDFLPCTGRVDAWEPAGGSGVRVDSGIAAGQEISPFYDPMIAKVVAHGPDRDTARQRLIGALKDTRLFGLTTNRRFLIDALGRDVFAQGKATTAFIGDTFAEADLIPPTAGSTEAAAAAVLQFCRDRDRAQSRSVMVSNALMGWSSTGALVSRYVYDLDGVPLSVSVSPEHAENFAVSVDDTPVRVRLDQLSRDAAELVVDGRRLRAQFHEPEPGRLDLAIDGQVYAFRNAAAGGAATDTAAGGRIAAPMHGTVLEVLVDAGDTVAVGTRLAVLEAMKMQHDILAPVAGTVAEVMASAGGQVAADAPLFEIEEAAS